MNGLAEWSINDHLLAFVTDVHVTRCVVYFGANSYLCDHERCSTATRSNSKKIKQEQENVGKKKRTFSGSLVLLALYSLQHILWNRVEMHSLYLIGFCVKINIVNGVMPNKTLLRFSVWCSIVLKTDGEVYKVFNFCTPPEFVRLYNVSHV